MGDGDQILTQQTQTVPSNESPWGYKRSASPSREDGALAARDSEELE